MSRPVQEALTNCCKHAGPHCTVEVMLRYRRADLEVDISDDGAGAASSPGQGFGLIGMPERVAAVGGRVEAGSKPRGGYRVRAHSPYRTATPYVEASILILITFKRDDYLFEAISAGASGGSGSSSSSPL